MEAEKKKNSKTELEQVFTKTFEEAVATELNNLPEYVRNKIRDHAAEALGFSRRWSSGWEVDHCNGRMSSIRDIISESAKVVAREALNELITKDYVKSIIDNAKTSVLKDFNYEFKRSIEEAMRPAIQKEIQGLIAETVEKTKNAFQKQLGDLLDPNSLDSELATAIIELHLKTKKKQK